MFQARKLGPRRAFHLACVRRCSGTYLADVRRPLSTNSSQQLQVKDNLDMMESSSLHPATGPNVSCFTCRRETHFREVERLRRDAPGHSIAHSGLTSSTCVAPQHRTHHLVNLLTLARAGAWFSLSISSWVVHPSLVSDVIVESHPPSLHCQLPSRLSTIFAYRNFVSHHQSTCQELYLGGAVLGHSF